MADWSEIEALKRIPLTKLFADDPERLGKYSADVSGIHFDWSKTHLTDEAIKAFEKLAKASERGEGAKDDVASAQALHARMRALIDAIEAEALGPIRNILHVGIGGSALGPDLLIDALGREANRYEVAIVSNVDGLALEEAFKRFDPSATLLAIASKTFTTTETMLNAESVIEWMQAGGVEDPYGRVVALTADPDKAIEWGVDETRVLPFADTVGGRYSLWSSIGFPAAMALSWDAFSELLEGAAEMDRHFRLSALHENVPALAAFTDLLYTQAFGCETRGVFCYDERLRLLPSYLQQLEMESNGKGATIEGKPVGRPTAPITWGGVGTDQQHAVFQLLHQGTHVVPL
ncbi:MAG: glucose-6-phosphate isomerase, partial [Sphingomonadales bacterium]|nr:glucose-6-phosphate isomerase [Sphingomonadales bacterium]